MKKFIMITPHKEKCEKYEIATGEKLYIEGKTRFPLIPIINSYAERGEEISIIVLTPNTDSAKNHEQQFHNELYLLQEKKRFVCHGVETIPITYAGNVDTQLEIFKKLLSVFEAGDTIYACLTYGNKAMSIAELMAIECAYRIVDDVTIGCLIYGALDHSAYPARIRICDITALIHLDEIVRLLAGCRTADPTSIINHILAFSEEA